MVRVKDLASVFTLLTTPCQFLAAMVFISFLISVTAFLTVQLRTNVASIVQAAFWFTTPCRPTKSPTLNWLISLPGASLVAEEIFTTQSPPQLFTVKVLLPTALTEPRKTTLPRGPIFTIVGLGCETKASMVDRKSTRL